MDTAFFLSVFLFFFFFFFCCLLFVFVFIFFFFLFLFLFSFLFSFFFCFFVFPFLLPCYKGNHQPPSFSAIHVRYMQNDSNHYIFFETYHSWGLWWAYKSAADARPQAKFWQKDRRSKKWTRPSKNKQKTHLTELPKVVSPSSRVDTDVEMEVAYSCNIFVVSDSLMTCPDIQTRWCHSGIIEHFVIWGFRITP